MHWDGEWNDKARFTGRGKFLYVTTYGGITIIDVSNPAQPVRIGTFPDAFQHSMISLFGDHAYVLTADFPEGGVPPRHLRRIYDISAPSNPVLVTSVHVIDLEMQQLNLYAQGDYVYIFGPEMLTVVDVQNPVHPQVMGQLNDTRLAFNTAKEPRIMAVRNGYGYIVAGHRDNRYFHIVDLHDPMNPTYVTTYDQGGNAHVTDIIVDGNYLYLGLYLRSCGSLGFFGGRRGTPTMSTPWDPKGPKLFEKVTSIAAKPRRTEESRRFFGRS